MIELVAENAVLRLLLLLLLFAIVAVSAYFAAQSLSVRHLTRRRLVEAGPRGIGAPTLGSLRAEHIECVWHKLVNSIEASGLSLVDTKDAALRQKLIAAGFSSSYAPRVYTLLRLVLVFGLPLLVLLFFWMSGSSPSMIKLYFSLVTAAAMGLYLPTLFIRARADRRQRELI